MKTISVVSTRPGRDQGGAEGRRADLQRKPPQVSSATAALDQVLVVNEVKTGDFERIENLTERIFVT